MADTVTTDFNTAELTDHDLAQAYRLLLHIQYEDGKDSDFLFAEAENEILARADVPLDETEQGLSPAAVRAVDAWVASHKEETHGK